MLLSQVTTGWCMENILIIQAARFGDLIQTKRLVLSLGRRFRTHLLVDESLVVLARLVYPESVIHSLGFHGNDHAPSAAACIEICDRLREYRFACVYNCNFSPLTTALCRMFEPEIVFVYRPANDSEGGILRSPWARLIFRSSASRRLASLNLVDFWGWFVDDPIAPTDVNPRAEAGGRGIGIALGGREARRSLPGPILGDIVKTLFRLRGEPDLKLFGSREQIPLAKRLMRHFTPDMMARTRDLTGKTGWLELMSELAGLDLLLTPDTGIMHLAAHLGVPVMAFFLSSAWVHETGPYGLGHIIWQAAPSCAPCLENAGCPHNRECLNPFDGKIFSRQLAYLEKGDMDAAMRAAPNLLCYRTGFDDFGAILKIVAGEDMQARQRAMTRAFIAAFRDPLRFHPPVGPQPSIMAGEFCPVAEWMLPPWRYC